MKVTLLGGEMPTAHPWLLVETRAGSHLFARDEAAAEDALSQLKRPPTTEHG